MQEIGCARARAHSHIHTTNKCISPLPLCEYVHPHTCNTANGPAQYGHPCCAHAAAAAACAQPGCVQPGCMHTPCKLQRVGVQHGQNVSALCGLTEQLCVHLHTRCNQQLIGMVSQTVHICNAYCRIFGDYTCQKYCIYTLYICYDSGQP